MPAFKDITGQRFVRLVALRFVGKQGKQSIWELRCDCGNLTTASISNIGRSVTSCGCLHREKLIAQNMTHGHSVRSTRTRTYNIWALMLQRCENPDNPAFEYYGMRGIKVCERWHYFWAFLAELLLGYA
jgi:hypothetical protein